MKNISTQLAAHIAGDDSSIAHIICSLGIINQNLINRSINNGLFREIRFLKNIDSCLVWLLNKSKNFDFVQEVARGRTLLVGEGNLSFALSLASMESMIPSIATNEKLVACKSSRKDDLPRRRQRNNEKFPDKFFVNCYRLSGNYLREDC